MSLIELFFIAVGLSMDAFAVAICKGLSMQKMNVRHAVIIGLYFGGFQALMPLIGYLLGCSNMSIYVSRYKKVDIRAVGAGNPGTANTVLTLGWGPGVMVGLHDIGKGALSALIAILLFPQYAGIAVVAGSACVIGHIFPVFMKFKGGKGFAAYIGMWLVVD